MSQNGNLQANITPGLSWVFLSPFGRVSRQVYWLGFVLSWIVIGLAANMWVASLDPDQIDATTFNLGVFMSSNPLFPLLFIALQWFELALVIKRFQDINLSGFFALLTFVPVLNFLVVLFLGFLPSFPGANRYGPLPNSYFTRPK